MSQRRAATLTAADLGFALAPRINAAGRLEDMGLGIECLLTDEAGRARELAERLHEINAERRDLQAAMVEQGEALVQQVLDRRGDAALPWGLVLYEPGWHAGVVGLVASRLKERLHRPVIAFAPAGEDATGELKELGALDTWIPPARRWRRWMPGIPGSSCASAVTRWPRA